MGRNLRLESLEPEKYRSCDKLWRLKAMVRCSRAFKLIAILACLPSIVCAFDDDEGITLEALEEEAGLTLEDLEAEAAAEGGGNIHAAAGFQENSEPLIFGTPDDNANTYTGIPNNAIPNMNAGESYSSGAEHKDGPVELEVKILEPRNGQVLPADPAFEVRVELNLVQGRTEVLLNSHADSSLCISLDQAPSACWPLFSKQQVRFKAEAGLHTIYAYFTDPVTGDMAENSRSSTVTFRLGPSDAPRLQQPPPQMQVELPNAENEPEPEQVEIAIPGINLMFPSDQDVIPDDRFDVLLAVTSPDIKEFQTHFKGGWVAVSLDGNHYACFPIVDAQFYPRFLNVPGGVHFLEAQLVHPQTFELISETSSGPTTFQSRPRPSARTLHEVTVSIDGQNKVFQGHPHASRGLKALSFCNENNVFDSQCVLGILRNLISKISSSF